MIKLTTKVPKNINYFQNKFYNTELIKFTCPGCGQELTFTYVAPIRCTKGCNCYIMPVERLLKGNDSYMKHRLKYYNEGIL